MEVVSDVKSEFTQRLEGALKNSFQSALDFFLNPKKGIAGLVVTISSYQDWRDGTEITCTIEFASVRNEILGIGIASCLSDQPATCATQILKDAKIAAFFLDNPAPVAMPATIPEIKENAMKYDARVVQVSGHLSSGHYGMFLDNEDHSNGIRLRSPGGDAVPCPVPIFRNELFDKFWIMRTETDYLDPNKSEIRATIEGFVRVLKVNGKAVTEYYTYEQWPLEVIVTRVISTVSIEKSPWWEEERPPILPPRRKI